MKAIQRALLAGGTEGPAYWSTVMEVSERIEAENARIRKSFQFDRPPQQRAA